MPCRLSVSSTDRWSVQLDNAPPTAASIRFFQYPLRIDGRCNAREAGEQVLGGITFSILYGSMVGATCLGGEQGTRTETFSILYGSMVGATFEADLVLSIHDVSFSILYGSMVGATQPRRAVWYAGAALSVSSTDRWSVQRRAHCRQVRQPAHFQYPLRIDGRCNCE